VLRQKWRGVLEHCPLPFRAFFRLPPAPQTCLDRRIAALKREEETAAEINLPRSPIDRGGRAAGEPRCRRLGPGAAGHPGGSPRGADELARERGDRWVAAEEQEVDTRAVRRAERVSDRPDEALPKLLGWLDQAFSQLAVVARNL